MHRTILALTLAGILGSSACTDDRLLSPSELDQQLTISGVSYQPRDTSIRLSGSIDLDVSFGNPTTAKVLVRNQGAQFSHDEGVRLSLTVLNAAGSPLDGATQTKYGLLGGGRETLFEMTLDAPHDSIVAERVTFEMVGR